MKSITLTGATSMVGVALIKACIKQNIKIYAFIRKGSSKMSRLPLSPLVTIIECDLEALAEFVVPAIMQSDVFYHLGWSFTDKINRADCAKQLKNVQYTLAAVHLAARMGCKKFVGAGSQAECGNASRPLNGDVPVNPEIAYGVAKYVAGKFAQIECEKLALEYNWVRILSVYGSNDNDGTLIKAFVDNCKNNHPMPLSPCTHIWDYLFEDDAGRALLAVGEKGIAGKTYCLGSGVGNPLKEYLEIIKNMINPEYIPQYGEVPYVEKSVQYLCADISELTADIGWKPEISFEEGIKKIITPPDRK